MYARTHHHTKTKSAVPFRHFVNFSGHILFCSLAFMSWSLSIKILEIPKIPFNQRRKIENETKTQQQQKQKQQNSYSIRKILSYNFLLSFSIVFCVWVESSPDSNLRQPLHRRTHTHACYTLCSIRRAIVFTSRYFLRKKSLKHSVPAELVRNMKKPT